MKPTPHGPHTKDCMRYVQAAYELGVPKKERQKLIALIRRHAKQVAELSDRLRLCERCGKEKK